MRTESFESSSRQSSLEIISTMAESSPKMLRDQLKSLQDNFFPAIALMMLRKDIETQKDLEQWAEEAEEEILAKNDTCSVAAEALERISEHIGEKTVI